MGLDPYTFERIQFERGYSLLLGLIEHVNHSTKLSKEYHGLWRSAVYTIPGAGVFVEVNDAKITSEGSFYSFQRN